jgi:DNA-binding response OmpR family regulator
VPQLEARIRAVLRRAGESGASRARVVVGGLEIDVAARRTTLDGVELDLSPREFDLLRHLAERAGEVVTKKQLLTEVWQQPWGGSDKTVDVHLSWLRRKLGESATEPRYLTTVRGVGVRLTAPEV